MSTQGASSSSSPSSSTPQWKYDVFLSFRGKDTRYSFTDHLYNALIQKGIFTFRDNEELETGKPISPELLKAIKESRFAIVILSRSYASSKWCLDELAEIVKCKKEREMTVLPVFYLVDPSNVRNQRGTFEKAFAEHEGACNIRKVKTWRVALGEVANLSGWHVEERRYESKEIRHIVEYILRRLSSTLSSITKNLVGIDSPLKKLIALYLGHGHSTCMIGICGMGGLGKTTLARMIYETVRNHFEGSGFIADIREVSKNRGLNQLQEQLLEQILGERKIKITDVYHGVDMIMGRLRHKKVLVVLDDVNELDQLEKLVGHGWFGLGSWIIITTRDEHLLVQHGVHKRYKPDKLNDRDALKLFCLKAFKNEQPKEGYMQLSQDVVYYADRLPLALVILGSFLVGRTMDEWQSALDSFKKFPRREIIDVLKVSYDGLEEMEKEIFLDIACFFRGETKDRVIEILESCGFHARIGISTLRDKSLLTIENEKLCMHDLLQEMGREIVRRESRGDPGKRSRLWLQEDLFHVLTKDTATKSVQAIALNSNAWEEEYFNFEAIPEPFSKMCNLRLVINHGVLIPNGLNLVPDDLRYLEWIPCSLKFFPSRFQPREHVELNLRTSQIKYLWEGVKHLDKLKCINLRDSSYLIQTPDFIGIPMLERLYLSGCFNLVEIHSSIGQLRRLVVLDLEGCFSLTKFPSMTTEMESLTILNLSGCSKIRKIPEFKGIMKSLSELYLDKTAIEKLPSSIECLTALTTLTLKGCENLECLPSNIDSFRSLKKLFLFGCSKLANLPENLWKIKCLEEVELSWMSRLEGIWLNRIGCLSSLKYLTLCGNSFVTLPASISQLSKLKALDLWGCYKLQSLPKLPSTVRYINAQNCNSLKPQPCSQSRWYDERSHGVAFTILICYLQGLLCRKTGYEPSTKTKEDDESGTEFQIIIPAKAIPSWLTHRRLGNSIRIDLPPNWCNSSWMGFALCACFNRLTQIYDKVFGLRAHVTAPRDMPHSHYSSKIFFSVRFGLDHIWLLYLSRDDWFATIQNGECSQIEVVFETTTPDMKVWECGVCLVYEQDVEELSIAQCGSNY